MFSKMANGSVRWQRQDLCGGEALVPTCAGVVVLQHLRHVFLHGREVAQVRLALDRGLVWRRNGQGLHALPVEAGEPRMPLQIRHATRSHRQPLARLMVQQLADQVGQDTLDLRRKRDLADAFCDLRVGLHRAGTFEWRVSGHQLEDEDAQSPPINRIGVPYRRDDLRSEVVGRSTSRKGLADRELGQSHIRELNVALICEQQVLGLQVSIDDAPFMQMVKGKNCTGGIVFAMLLAAMKALPVVGGIQLAA
mmetsp:Transcript_32598/g.93611  ORF Transcript_32598/g.93611 Transcript_32598/m.93611 type:complete len:251 (-) Transcript_32598:1776-2528(-)